ATAESYSVAAAYGDARLDATVDFSASPLSRFLALPFAGSLDGTARLQGRLDRPDVGFKLRVRDLKVEGEPVSLSAEGAFDWKTLRLSALGARYRGQEIRSGSASLSLDDASSSLSLSFLGNLGGERLAFSLAAEGKSELGSGGDLSSMFGAYSLRGTVQALQYGAVKAESWPFLASRSSSGLSFRGGESSELVASYKADGSFSFVMRDPLPLRLVAEGRVVGSTIEASASGIEADLGALGALLPPGAFGLQEGSATGALSIRGLVADPEISGSIDLRGAVCAVKQWVPDPIGPLDGSIVAQGRSFAFFVPSAPVGSGRISVRASAGLDHWAPTNLKLSVSSIEGTSLRADLAVGGVKVQGETTLDLDLELRGEIVALNMNFYLTRANVVIGSEVLGQQKPANAPEAGRQTSFVNLTATVRPGRGVQIFFPSQDIPIVSGFAEPSSALLLRYDEATDDFSAKGAVGIRGGTVFYIQRDFFLRSGRLVVNETAGKFDPLVTILAELRDRTDSGPVLITLRADNAPISNFKPRLSSDPVMTEAQIAALLGANLLGVTAEEPVDLRKAVISTSEFIPQLNVSKAFERRVRDTLGLDVFFLHTEVLQRWLIDLSDPTTTSAVDPLGRYLDQTALYAGKYVADSVFVHGSARLREDPLVRASGLRLDSELGLEFDTPFGLVQWSVAPSHPENLFISDQSLSITWRLSL
ncbi:MAG TPA: translocation/assembly module TamB domain-containing protein, partial [Rectinemataceae bacterium]|nr:translocation/assembly module TamB domain-containing protein [Rectinemataceae bacterium]